MWLDYVWITRGNTAGIRQAVGLQHSLLYTFVW